MDLTREIGREGELTKDDAERLVQDKLSAANMLLKQAEKLAKQHGLEINFLEMNFKPSLGWSKNGVLIVESEWNYSGCVIGLGENAILIEDIPETIREYDRLWSEERDRNRR